VTAFSVEMLGLIAPALAAGMIVSAIHVPLGQEVLRRGIIFIDLAIAQIAALGTVFGLVVLQAENEVASFLLALLFAFLGSFLFAWLEMKIPQYQEALIGCAFVISASLILILLAGDPHGGEEVEGLLAGQILWASWMRTGWAAILYAVALAAWHLWPQRRKMLFYCLFPAVVTVSVQLVGVYLVFASLILPALGAQGFHEKFKLTAGYGIAFSAVIAGLAVSVMADLPAGPVLVCSFAVASLIAFYAVLQLRRA